MYIDDTLLQLPVPATGVYDITIPIPDDDIALEYDNDRRLRYEHVVPGFIGLVEAQGEFIRDTAIVKIIDNDGNNIRILYIMPSL